MITQTTVEISAVTLNILTQAVRMLVLAETPDEVARTVEQIRANREITAKCVLEAMAILPAWMSHKTGNN